MALRFIDGFDHLSTNAQYAYKYNATYNYVVGLVAGRRSGSYAVNLQNTSSFIGCTLDEQTTWIIGFAFCIQNTISSGDLVRFQDSSGNNQLTIVLNTDGTLSIWSSSTRATSVKALAVGAWNYIEVKHILADANGSCEIRVNGETWATFTGDTKYQSTTTEKTIKIYGRSAYASYLDDLYICDGTGAQNNDFLGDCRVDTVFPTGTGAATDFTPTGTTTNWDNVNDASPDDDTTYNASNVTGAVDSFGFGDLAALNGTIFGVQTNLVAKKDDAGSRTMRAIARIGGNNYEGSDMALGSSYLDYRQVFETNPATSTAWTTDAINAAEFGYKVQA